VCGHILGESYFADLTTNLKHEKLVELQHLTNCPGTVADGTAACMPTTFAEDTDFVI